MNTALPAPDASAAPDADLLERIAAIGLNLTGNLDLDGVFQALRREAGSLLDATSFMLWWREPDGAGLSLRLGDEAGQPLPARRVDWHDPGSNVARCARDCVEVVLNVPRGTQDAQHMPGTQFMHSALFGPLVVGAKVMGVLSVQSPNELAYGDAQRHIFRTLCAFGAIGVNNAHAYRAMQDAQAAMQAEQARYRNVVEHVSEAVCIYQDGRIVLCNSKACRLTGYPAEELVGKTFEQTTYVGDIPATATWIRQHLKQQAAPRYHRFRALRKDGKVVWTEASMEAIVWDGRPAVIGVFTDLTERMGLDHALRRSEELHRALVTHAQEGILVVQDGCIVFANPKADRLIGAHLGGRAVDRLFSMVPEADARTLRNACQGLLHQGKDSHFVNEHPVGLVAESGAVRWLAFSAVCVEWEHQPGLLVFLSDLTRCTENELRARSATLAAPD
jgi:PAS domain S-box-containing protein